MKTIKHPHTYLYKEIGGVLFLLCGVVVTGCLGLLWQRQQIERTATATRLLETEMVKEERRLRYLDTKIAEIHQPLFLESQVEHLGLALRAPTSQQVIYIDDRALRRHVETVGAEVARQPTRDLRARTFDLAVIETRGATD